MNHCRIATLRPAGLRPRRDRRPVDAQAALHLPPGRERTIHPTTKTQRRQRQDVPAKFQGRFPGSSAGSSRPRRAPSAASQEAPVHQPGSKSKRKTNRKRRPTKTDPSRRAMQRSSARSRSRSATPWATASDRSRCASAVRTSWSSLTRPASGKSDWSVALSKRCPRWPVTAPASSSRIESADRARSCFSPQVRAMVNSQEL